MLRAKGGNQSAAKAHQRRAGVAGYGFHVGERRRVHTGIKRHPGAPAIHPRGDGGKRDAGKGGSATPCFLAQVKLFALRIGVAPDLMLYSTCMSEVMQLIHADAQSNGARFQWIHFFDISPEMAARFEELSNQELPDL